MADVLKDVGNVSMTAEQIADEAISQAEANVAMTAINHTKETLHNVTVGNADERRDKALAARATDQATIANMAKPVVKTESKWKWLTDLVNK